MIELTAGQVESVMARGFWPFVRIAACIMVAPTFGARFVPRQFKIALAGAIALLAAPLTPATDIAPFSLAGIIVTIQQVLIGLATGFVMQVIFDSLAMGGQLLANSMGLSFAFNIDPQHGASTAVIGQLYMLLVMLTFLALNGHIALLETLVNGFKTLPIGMAGLGPEDWQQVAVWGRQLFEGALTVALPGMTALLIVNLGFGVMSRAAPALNMFAVGFPITLTFGMVIVMLGLPAVQASFANLFQESVALVRWLLDAR